LNPIDTVYSDLASKPLAVVGEGKHGKTSVVKHLVAKALNDGYRVKAFDISLEWFYNVPLPYKQTCLSPHSYVNKDNCVYDLSLLGNDERRVLIASIIYNDWLNLRDMKVTDYERFLRQPRILMIFDEGSSYLSSRAINKADHWGTVLTDFLASGRNFKQDGIIIARAISGEIATKYRRKCNYLLGKIMGEEEIGYLRRGTSRDFIETTKTLPPYHFIYYGSEVISKPFTFPHRGDYGEPRDVTPKPIRQPENRQAKGLWRRLFG